MLRVGVEPRDGDADVAVQDVAALDDRIAPILSAVCPWRCTLTLGWNQVSSPRSLTRCRHHHTRSLVFVFPGVIVFDENISWVIDHTSSCIFSEEGFFLGQASGDQLERKTFGVPELRRPFLAERGGHPLELAARQAVREGENRGAIDRR